jgi:hypothetical protein
MEQEFPPVAERLIYQVLLTCRDAEADCDKAAKLTPLSNNQMIKKSFALRLIRSSSFLRIFCVFWEMVVSCIICDCVTVIALDVSEGVGPLSDAVEIGSLEHEAVVSWRLQQVQIFFFFQSMAFFVFSFPAVILMMIVVVLLLLVYLYDDDEDCEALFYVNWCLILASSLILRLPY